MIKDMNRIARKLRYFLSAAVLMITMALPGPAQAQNTVSGIVVDETGTGIPGASIVLEGESLTGTMTDIDGQFSLKVQAQSTITVSCIGFVSKTLTVKPGDSVKVILVEDQNLLNEVVVVGYGTLEKKLVTNSIASVSGEKLMKGVSPSVGGAMQGLVSGLVVTSADSPNDSPSFQLRGMSSVNAGSSPLIVIDGFVGGSINSLNMEDIKSIDVLKDASAGAIYGTRAASGVILITTKKGSYSDGKVHVSYENELTHRQSYRELEFLSRDEYLQYIDPKGDMGGDTNWYDSMLNHKNFSHRHHFSLDAGGENFKVFASVTYSNNEGIAINDKAKTLGGHVATSWDILDKWVTINLGIDYYQKDGANYWNCNHTGTVAHNSFAQAMINNPTMPVYQEGSPTGYYMKYGVGTLRNTVGDANLLDYTYTTKTFRPVADVQLNVKPVTGLTAKVSFGYNFNDTVEHTYKSKYFTDTYDSSQNGHAYIDYGRTYSYSVDSYLSFVRSFGDHNINAVAGTSYYEDNSDNFSLENYDFTNDVIGYWDIGAGTGIEKSPHSISSSRAASIKLMAYFARANYSYKDKYLLGASIRREGSSKFGADNRWGTFWSVSAGWRINKENFLADATWINDLKLRAGYGVTGNNNFSAYYTANYLSSAGTWIMPDGSWQQTYGKSQNINDNLGWEENHEANIGLDYAFFGNRLFGKIDIYKRHIKNMIYATSVSTPPYLYTSMISNIGELETKGIEFEIGGRIVDTKDFQYSSNLMLSSYKSTITTLYGDQTYMEGNPEPFLGFGNLARIEAGATVGDFYLYKHAGFDGGWQVYNKDGEVISANAKKEADKVHIGNYIPKLTLTWNHSLAYKDWDFSLNLRSWLDFDVYNTYNMFMGTNMGIGWNLKKDKYLELKDKVSGFPPLSSYWLEDASFLKIDALTLGYTFHFKNCKILESIRLYATGGNLATFTKYTGINPEVDITGWTNGTDWFHKMYPYSRTYTFGMQFKF